MDNLEEVKRLLQDKQIVFKKDVELKYYTTLHIGGRASILTEPNNIEEIRYLMKISKEHHIPYLILGNGSNTLVSDKGFYGIVIILATNFHKIYKRDHKIYAQSGADLRDVCLFAYKNSLTGLEFAYGIPGSSGGTTYMNAGAYGGEVGDKIVECQYLDEEGELCTIKKQDLQFSYRHSYFFHRNIIILNVVYELMQGYQANIKEQMDVNMHKRAKNQPLEYYSAGSTFKRPQGNYASKLINDCGLKGLSYGDAEVSQKHSGFLINKGEATFQDFMNLINEVKSNVYDHTGYELECEVKIIE